ncbi:MAG: hypothetical protein NT029_06055 [Armatimonadetes bacterium]|nr:hypothetical protein [Armatimonadota bacterium]
MRIFTVFYEDQLGIAVKDFGPHTLLLQCLADRTGGAYFDLGREVVAVPKKGNNKLLACLRGEDCRRAIHRGPACAVFDEDKVRKMLALPATACKSAALAALREGAEEPLAIILLERNVETLVRACLEALCEPAPPDLHKHEVRDRALNRLACGGSPDQRRRVLVACPSFARLVNAVAAALEPA